MSLSGQSRWAKSIRSDAAAREKARVMGTPLYGLFKFWDKWIDFMMKYELDLEKPDANRARNSAATIGISYIIGGLIPLSAYFLTHSPLQGLMISALLTVICLFIFGYFKSKVTGQPPLKGALKATLIGITAATAAFLIAKTFNNLF